MNEPGAPRFFSITMNSYSYIESLFRSILAQSKTIQGRFYLLPKSGAELNSDQLGQVLSENVQVKYPLCVLIPPRSLTSEPWASYHFTLFFLDTVYYDSDNQIKELIATTQTSGRSIIKEWDQMQKVAIDFTRVLDLVQRGSTTTGLSTVNNLFRFNKKSQQIIPVSFSTVNRLGGVRLDFDAKVFIGCDIDDYVEGGDIILPPSTNGSSDVNLDVLREEVATIAAELGVGGGSFVFNEVPTGAINGVNATFLSLNDFVPETVEVIVSGVLLTPLQDYNTSGNRTINLFASPGATENIFINYQKA